MAVSHRFLPLAALVAAIGFSGCGGSSLSTTQALPAEAPNVAARTTKGSLQFKTYTAGVTPGFHKNSFAYDLALGPDGSMWFTDGLPAIGKITATGQVTEYTKGLFANAKPYSIIAGPDGNMWFTDICGGIGRITPQGRIDEFSTLKISKAASPDDIVVGKDGAMWANAQGPPNFLIRSDLSGNLSSLKIPQRLDVDGSLTVDAAGNFWMMAMHLENGIMLERKANGGFVEHSTGLVHAAALCCPNFAPKRLTIGPDGNPWYTTLYWLRPNAGGAVIATTTAAATTLFDVNKTGIDYPAIPSGITTMGKHVWFAGDDPFQVNGALWRIDAGGKQTAFPIPYSALQVAADGSGNLWMTAEGFNDPAQIIEVVAPK
jgi:streptogramin lyase